MSRVDAVSIVRIIVLMNNFQKPLRNKMIMLAVAAKRTYREIGAACDPPISSARVEQIVKQERNAGRLPNESEIPAAWIEPFIIGNPDAPATNREGDGVDVSGIAMYGTTLNPKRAGEL